MSLKNLLESEKLGKVLVLHPEKLETASSDPLAVISIDGGCASGKSFIAKRIADKLDFELVFADDFFLPPEMRTSERFSQPGGNLDRERFAFQVLPYLGSGRAFEYDIFDCSLGKLCGKRRIEGGKPIIVEGSYSNHPSFGDIYSLRIFVTCEKEERLQRILERNGEKMLRRFEDEWIPLEDRYFEKFSVMESSDIIINTSTICR